MPSVECIRVGSEFGEELEVYTNEEPSIGCQTLKYSALMYRDRAKNDRTLH